MSPHVELSHILQQKGHQRTNSSKAVNISNSTPELDSHSPRGGNDHTQVLHEQIKYCFIQIFFIHTARVNYGNNKMCINKSEDRIVHYRVATVSKYVIGGCTYK